MDLTRNPIIKGSEPVINEGILPVELQSPNIVHPSHQAIITPNRINGRSLETQIDGDPYVSIAEQPQQRGFRFRYECEGPSHGGLQGVKSARGKKSFPTIKIHNFTGAARVVVTLVTDEKSPRCHAHKLVGTNCRNGTGMIELQSNYEPISFPNLCILHVTRKKLVDVLAERILDTIRLAKKLKANNINLEAEVTDDDRHLAKIQAQEQSKSMHLNVVRLCFQVFLRNPDGSFGKMLTPVVSQPIYDSKSPGASALKICRMDKYGGCCSGNEEVFLLCEKVQKDDIQVRFVEQTPDGKVKWESYGNFGPLDVHRQYAIVFKTPAYHNKNIDKPVNVSIMLQRRSDQESSEPFAFTYFPQNRDKDNIASKKRKRIPLDSYDFGDGDGGAGGFNGGGFGGDGGGGGGGDMDDDSGGGGEMQGDGNGLPGSYVFDNTTDMDHQQSYLGINTQQPSGLNIPTQDGEDHLEVTVVKPEYKTQCITSIVTPPTPDHTPWNDNSSHKEVDRDTPTSHNPLPGPSLSTISLDVPPSDGGFYSSDTSKHDKNSLPLLSTDYLDSGLETASPKSSISSLSKLELLSPSSSISDTRVDGKSEQSSPSKLSTQSDSDLKVDHVFKSDEGFSESSEVATSSETHPSIKSPSKKEVKIVNEHVKLETVQENVFDAGDRMSRMMSVKLRDYVETGNVLYLLLAQQYLMVISNHNGDLPLHLAIINGQLQVVRNLLKTMKLFPDFKTYIDLDNFLRQTPLHLATILGQQAVVELLLHYGANSSKADRNGNTAPHLAIQYNQQACLDTLVKYITPGNLPFNPFPELNYLNFQGYSPTHLAAMTGNLTMLKRLVFGRADINLPDGKSGKTCLHHAVDNQDLVLTQYLLSETNCDVNARCFDGNTALHIACSRQQVTIVSLLVTGGANVEAENEEVPDLDTMGDGVMSGQRGHIPADYADGNEEILSILDNDYCLMATKGCSASLSMDVHQSNTDPDFELLSTKNRIALSRLLDANVKDIEALTNRLMDLGLNPNWRDVTTTGGSPTTFILEYMETNKSSLKLLSDNLVAIGRKDAADLLGP